MCAQVPSGGLMPRTTARKFFDVAMIEAGMRPSDLVKLTIYLTDPEDVGPFMAAAGGSLPQPPPATTLLLVAGLASPELKVEIEAVAAH